MEEYIFIKTDANGNKELNLKNNIHKQILLELYNPKSLITLSENLSIPQNILLKELNILEKAKLIKNSNNTFSTNFIILNKDITEYLHEEIKKFSEYLAINIVECFKTNKKQILSVCELDEDICINLFILIATDIIYMQLLEKLNYNFNEKRIITGQVSIGNKYIFKTNIVCKKDNIFIYGDKKTKNIITFTIDEYFQIVYNVYKLCETLKNNNILNIITRLKTYTHKSLNEQIKCVVENQIVYLRYEVINWCLTNYILKENLQMKFIIKQ